MAVSNVEICNMALSRVGSYRISSIDDASVEGRSCKLHYEQARDSVLRDHDWGFARKRLPLSTLAEEYDGWEFAYLYPPDCVNVRKIYDGNGSSTGTSYDIDKNRYVPIGKVQYEIATNSGKNQKIILSDKEDALLIYTARVTDANMFDSIFVQALSWRLAAELAIPLRGKIEFQDSFIQKYQFVLSEARGRDANESRNKDEDVNIFHMARG